MGEQRVEAINKQATNQINNNSELRKTGIDRNYSLTDFNLFAMELYLESDYLPSKTRAVKTQEALQLQERIRQGKVPEELANAENIRIGERCDLASEIQCKINKETHKGKITAFTEGTVVSAEEIERSLVFITEDKEGDHYFQEDPETNSYKEVKEKKVIFKDQGNLSKDFDPLFEKNLMK